MLTVNVLEITREQTVLKKERKKDLRKKKSKVTRQSKKRDGGNMTL